MAGRVAIGNAVATSMAQFASNKKYKLSLALGPVSLSLSETFDAMWRLLAAPFGADHGGPAELILGQIRLPRTLLGLSVGAVLALSGVAMQGLFRNPLADPGLIGVSSGAALGAAVTIIGGNLVGGIAPWLDIHPRGTPLPDTKGLIEYWCDH